MQALVGADEAGTSLFAAEPPLELAEPASAAARDDETGAATTAASGSGVETAGLGLGGVEAVADTPAVAALAVAGALGVTAAHATIAENPTKTTERTGGGRIVTPPITRPLAYASYAWPAIRSRVGVDDGQRASPRVDAPAIR